MAVKFLEPGGDADFLVEVTNGFWAQTIGTTPTIVTSPVHGSHVKSINYSTGTTTYLRAGIFGVGVLADSGSRISFYLNITTAPGALAIISQITDSSGTSLYQLKLTTGNVLQLFANGAQVGSNGSTLSTGVWYRISIAYTVASTSVNEVRIFKDGVSDISVSNATLATTGSTFWYIGRITNTTGNWNTSDHYIDDSSSLTDTGNIWVTAKRPVSNGTTNGFTTQIGSGGSGYGTGHSPQVNERPLSTTNGWSMIGAGSAITEEYNVEGKSVGDIDISTATIVDWLGWVSIKSLVAETVSVILDGATVSQAITSTITLYTKVKGSSTYPSGTGTDVGVITDTSLTTVSLYECGVIVAYIPTSTTINSGFFFAAAQ